MTKSKKWTVEGSWIPRRLDVLQSAAWRNAPRALKSLLEILEIEHMRRKGSANGELFKSYPQFVKEGFNRTTVSDMTKLGEHLGLLKVNRETGVGSPDLKDACAYTLTYLPTGIIGNVAPTDEWRRIRTDDQAKAIIENLRHRKVSRRKARAAC